MADPRDRYFGFDAEAASTEPGRFVDVDAEVAPVPFSEGLHFRPVLGTNVLVNVVDFAPHTEAPRHLHEEEQIVIVLDGELEFEVGGDTRVVRPGEMVVIPPNVPHAARTYDSACREIDVFNPPRRALLDLLDAGDVGDPRA